MSMGQSCMEMEQSWTRSVWECRSGTELHGNESDLYENGMEP